MRTVVPASNFHVSPPVSLLPSHHSQFDPSGVVDIPSISSKLTSLHSTMSCQTLFSSLLTFEHNDVHCMHIMVLHDFQPTISDSSSAIVSCVANSIITLLKRFLWLGAVRFWCVLLYKKRSKIAEPRGTGMLLQFLAQAFKWSKFEQNRSMFGWDMIHTIPAKPARTHRT